MEIRNLHLDFGNFTKQKIRDLQLGVKIVHPGKNIVYICFKFCQISNADLSVDVLCKEMKVDRRVKLGILYPVTVFVHPYEKVYICNYTNEKSN